MGSRRIERALRVQGTQKTVADVAAARACEDAGSAVLLLARRWAGCSRNGWRGCGAL